MLPHGRLYFVLHSVSWWLHQEHRPQDHLQLRSSGVKSVNIIPRRTDTRLDKIWRRTDVVGIFPSRDAIIRLSGTVLGEYNDECMITRRNMSVGVLRKAQVGAQGI